MTAAQAVEEVFRREYGLVLAAVNRQLRDLELAEDVVSEAMTRALEVWPRRGIPDNPAAWLTTTARNRAIDRLRRRRNLERKQEEMTVLARLEAEAEESDHDPNIADERLRLIFTCCHPALPEEGRVALALKTLGGLRTGEVARAFLVSETTMYQRIVRAKRKIRAAGIPFEVPRPEDLPARLDSVLAVVYLIFNEGHLASTGDDLDRPDLAKEAIRLAELLVSLMPDEPEAVGLLALLLSSEARRAARSDSAGDVVLLEDQDRSRWDRSMIDRGAGLVERALRMGHPGPYQIEAAIAAVHASAAGFADTDWKQIAALYGELARHRPSPVVTLNQAVAVSMWRGPEAGLALIDGLGHDLDHYHLFHATRADLFRRTGRLDAAAECYRRALEIATNAAERRFLERRLAEVATP